MSIRNFGSRILGGGFLDQGDLTTWVGKPDRASRYVAENAALYPPLRPTASLTLGASATASFAGTQASASAALALSASASAPAGGSPSSGSLALSASLSASAISPSASAGLVLVAETAKAALYHSQVIADAPILNWRMEETSGSTAFDYSGNGFHGSTLSSATFGGPGLLGFGRSLSFDGVNDFVRWSTGVPPLSQAAAPSQTFEAWIQTTTTAVGQIVEATGSAGIAVRVNRDAGNAGKISASWGQSPTAWIDSTAIVNDGLPHHIVVTLTPSISTLYVDGVSQGTLATTSTGNVVAPVIYVGTTQGTANDYTGLISEVAFYGSALSQARVTAHYEAVGPQDPFLTEMLADSPWGLWLNNEVAGTTLADSSGNSRPMTTSGVVTLAQGGPFARSSSVEYQDLSDTSSARTDVVTGLFGSATCTIETWLLIPASATMGRTALVSTMSEATSGALITLMVALETDGSLYLESSAAGLNGPVLARDRWYHVVGSIGAAGMKLRVNKETVGLNPAQTGTASTSYSVFQRRERNAVGSGGDFRVDTQVRLGPTAIFAGQLADARTDAHYDSGVTTDAFISGSATTNTASLSLGASGSATAPIGSTASLDLSATATATGEAGAVAATATASLSLSGSGTGQASGVATGSLGLAGAVATQAAGGASGSLALSLSGSGSATVAAGGAALPVLVQTVNVVSAGSPFSVVITETPAVGDVLLLEVTSTRANATARTVSTVSGLGGAWTRKADGANTEIWVGEGSPLTSGAIEITMNGTGEVGANAYLVRGLTSTDVAFAETALATAGTWTGPSTSAGPGQFVIQAVTVLGDITYPTGATLPATGWTTAIYDSGSIAYGYGYRIPATSETHRIDATASSGSAGINEALIATVGTPVSVGTTGSLTLSASGTAGAASSATGSLALSGSASPAARATASASLSLAGSGNAQGVAAASGSLSLLGVSGGTAESSSSGSLTLGTDAPAPPSLVAAYAFNEGTGTTAAEASGGATITGVPGWTASGKHGSAMRLNLVAGPVVDPIPGPTTAFTIMLDAYIDGHANNNYTMFLRGDNADVGTLQQYATGGVEWYPYGPVLASTVTYGTWTHLAIVADGTARRVLIDGVETWSGTSYSTVTSLEPFSLGGGLGGYEPNIRIDNVRVFSTALTNAEIAALSGTAVGASGGTSAAAVATATGSLTLGGTAAVVAPVSSSGSLTLSATGVAESGSVAASAAATLSLSGSTAARGAAAATGSLALSGTATSAAVAVASASLSLTGSGDAQGVAAAASGALVLSGSGGSRAPLAASGSLALAASVDARSAAAATGNLALGGTAAGSAVSSTSGTLDLLGVAEVEAVLTPVGFLELSAGATTETTVTGEGGLELSGSASVVALVETTGHLELSSSAVSASEGGASGFLALTGSAVAISEAATEGSLTLAASTAAGPLAVATGSLQLSGSADARSATGATGSLSLSGTATAGFESSSGAINGTGSLALGGSASATGRSTASGSLVLGGSSSGRVSVSAAGSILLLGSAQQSSKAAGTLLLQGAVAARSRVSGTGSLVFGGSAVAGVLTSSAGLLTLSGAVGISSVATGSGSLTLSATASARLPAAAAASLEMFGNVTGSGRSAGAGWLALDAQIATDVQIVATGSLALSAVGDALLTSGATALLELFATGLAAGPLLVRGVIVMHDNRRLMTAVETQGSWVIATSPTARREIPLSDAFVLVDGASEQVSKASLSPAFILVDVAPAEPEAFLWQAEEFVVASATGEEFVLSSAVGQDFQVLSNA